MEPFLKAFLFVIIIIAFSCGCEKQSNEEQVVKENDTSEIVVFKENIILLTLNSDSLAKYVYDESKVLHTKTFQTDNIKETKYQYDSVGILKAITINNISNKSQMVLNPNYGTDNEIISFNSKIEYDDGREFDLVQEVEYDELGRITALNTFPQQTFTYEGKNVIKHGLVDFESLIMKDHSYEYDSKKNPLKEIGLPIISIESINENNIKNVISEWIEYPECLMDSTETPIHHLDSLYSSIYEYNSEDYPLVEYRFYKERTDTVRYFYE